MRRFSRIVSLVVLAGMLGTAAGCYGSFNLVKKVYRWNGTFGDKWVNEIGFLALNIVPVYGIAGAIDALILNSIEFWTGKNPVQASIDLPDQDAKFAVNADGTLTLTSDDGRTVTVVATSDGAEVRDADGVLLARSVRSSDGVTIYSPDGTALGSMSSTQIASLVE